MADLEIAIKIRRILDEAYDEGGWCGCMEGDIDGRYQDTAAEVAEKIAALFEKLMDARP